MLPQSPTIAYDYTIQIIKNVGAKQNTPTFLVNIFDDYDYFDLVLWNNTRKIGMSKIGTIFHAQHEKNYLIK